MKQIAEVRTNLMYLQSPDKAIPELKPMIELIVVHTDGFMYMEAKDGFKKTLNLVETRYYLDQEALKNIVAGMNVASINMNVALNHADVLNQISKHLKSPTGEGSK